MQAESHIPFREQAAQLQIKEIDLLRRAHSNSVLLEASRSKTLELEDEGRQLTVALTAVQNFLAGVAVGRSVEKEDAARTSPE
jgi:hypothetical protein